MLPLDKITFHREFVTTQEGKPGQRITAQFATALVTELSDDFISGQNPEVLEAELRQTMAIQLWRLFYAELMPELKEVGKHLQATLTQRDLPLHNFRSAWLHLCPDFKSIKYQPIETVINHHE